ncbi:CHC2 zinc finger domain-containing protein [Ihubacter massiliensis]|uniref:CHC2 zinc finger domain-containing protein n=1 Tax=Ihubacter massiliensis TaxID=1852367 RepID=UPI0011DD4E3C|nr:CHC2 zinc finger domain-containing protein [Ihubacter massiliensis]MCO7121943.1 CHC2 zinc finger domain-containing protein [Ihubacter massiliensis]
MRTDLARQITGALKLRDVMEFYGVKFNGRGFAKCPFHTEKTASLSIKNEHYKCFGCGAYGGIIDFVMESYGLSFQQALVKLDSDFSLGLIGRKPTYLERQQMAENRRIERLYKQIKADRHKEYLTLCNVHSVLFRRLCNGEEWLKEIVEKLDDLLDDFSGEEARLWETAMT